MNKNMRMLLIVGALAIAGYLAFRWYENKKAQQNPAEQSPTGALGTNLNSVAPELIGGSTGPSVGPVLSSPVNITLNETTAQTEPDMSGDQQEGVNSTSSANPMKRQKQSAGAQGQQPRSPGVTTNVGGKPPIERPAGPIPNSSTTVKPKRPGPRSAAKSPPAKRTTTPMKVQ